MAGALRRGGSGERALRVIEGGRAAAAGRGPVRRAPSRRVRRRRRAVAIFLMLLALGIVAAVLLGPLTRMVESRRNLGKLEGQLAEERSRTARLEERRAWGLSEDFAELEARKMGYVKPGEVPVIVLDYREEESGEGAPGGEALAP